MRLIEPAFVLGTLIGGVSAYLATGQFATAWLSVVASNVLRSLVVMALRATGRR